jgi:polyhydroxybutyrate depolymerase
MARKLFWLGLMLLWFGGIHTAHAQTELNHLTVNGADRTYTLYIPSRYDGTEAVPLVIVLHPFASSGKAVQALMGFDTLAEQDGFIVVYPDSADYDWNDGSYPSSYAPAMQPGDDVAFIAALIDHLAEAYTIDQDRVYLSGYAAGATMAFRLACEIPDRFAKIIVSGALMYGFHETVCQQPPAAPVSILVLLGALDDTAPVEGQESEVSGDESLRMYSLDETLSFWEERNRGQAEVSGYVLDGVGHNWPRIGDYTLNQVGIDMTVLVTSYFMDDGPLTIPTTDLSTLYSGYARSYVLYVPPSYDPAEPMPLVVVLHGRPGSGSGTAYRYDMNRVAREHGFLALYPDGLPVSASGINVSGHEWNYTRGIAGYQNTNVDDTDFILHLIDDLALDLNIDQQRLYLTGFSNGGFMTLRMACEAADRFAAFAPMGATFVSGYDALCENTRPVPIMYVHGTLDPIIPWDGLTSGGYDLSLSVPETTVYWAIHNGCDPDLVEQTVLPSLEVDPSTQVHRYEFSGCAENGDIIFYAIDGGVHALPGTRDRANYDSPEQVNMDMDTAETVWEFFEGYTLPE